VHYYHPVPVPYYAYCNSPPVGAIVPMVAGVASARRRIAGRPGGSVTDRAPGLHSESRVGPRGRSVSGIPRPVKTQAVIVKGRAATGVLATWWDTDDRIKFATNFGWGIGKYITDLGTLGGQDAVYNGETGELEALNVHSAYVGYERSWRPRLMSAFRYGVRQTRRVSSRSDGLIGSDQCPNVVIVLIDDVGLKCGLSKRNMPVRTAVQTNK
jgi:hypothetical protein